MVESAPFTHQQPLPAAGDRIRILHVHSAADNGNPMCTFETISLESTTHKYTAISYTWGDTTPVRKVACSDGQRLSLSKTLSDLFETLCNRHQSFTIYVDALCINQSDLVEKAHQVRLMGKVYKKAQSVIAWLGAADEHSPSAFQYIKNGTLQACLSRKKTFIAKFLSVFRKRLPKTQDVVDALMAVLTRLWFQRVWVIQEAILGKRVFVSCGDNVVEFDTFMSTLEWLWDCAESVDYMDVRHPSYLGFRCATRMFTLSQEFGPSRRIPLETLFESIFFYSATDPRDFVFAIRGIADSANLLASPDYNATLEQIFMDTAENVLCRGSSLDLLSMCGLGHESQALELLEYCEQPELIRREQLPTWVPDFRLLAYNEPTMAANNGLWNAGGPLHRQPVRLNRRFEVDAMILDEVVDVGEEIDTLSLEKLHSSLRAALSMVEKVSQASFSHIKPDTVWKTLVMNHNIHGELATPELGTTFEALLRALSSGKPWEEINQNEFYRIMRVRVDSWRTFVTKDGYFGVTWPIVTKGDFLCLLPGCRFPLILRPVDADFRSNEEWSCANLIGWCYVQGIMHGEAVEQSSGIKRVVLV